MAAEAIMQKFSNLLEGTVGKIAVQLSSQRHISALRDGMLFTLPFTLLGGICMILMFPPIPAETGVAFLDTWKAVGPTLPLFTAGYYLTMGILAVYATAGVAYSLAKSYDLHPGYYAFMAMAVFFTVACNDVSTPITEGVRGLALANLDASGMFTGIVVALSCVTVGAFMTKHNIMIRMPDAVPQSVAAVFEILLPFAVNYVLFSGINAGCESVLGYGLSALVVNIIAPVLSVGNSLPSVVLINVLVIGFWFFGIHGAAMMAAIVGTLQSSNLAANAAAIAAGSAPEFILAGSFKSIFATQIMFEAVLIAVLLFCKSDRLRSLAKVSLVPNIFNINEPVIFGLPLVMNVTLMLPTLVCTILNTAVSYLVMSAGLVGKVYIATVATIPSPINAFLSTMDFKAILLWFALFAVNLLIFAPFMKAYDKQVIAEDASAGGEE